MEPVSSQGARKAWRKKCATRVHLFETRCFVWPCNTSNLNGTSFEMYNKQPSLFNVYKNIKFLLKNVHTVLFPFTLGH